jgi:hypothetical protein
MVEKYLEPPSLNEDDKNGKQKVDTGTVTVGRGASSTFLKYRP